jgi:hypothetical protein
VGRGKKEKKKRTLIPSFSRKREKGSVGAGDLLISLSRSRERAG